MNPSSARTRASSRLIFDEGIETFAFRAVMALRMRVNISAIGSVMDVPLPARLDDARDVTTERELTEAHTAQPELAHERPRTAAQRAPVALLHFVLLLRAGHLVDRKLLRKTRHDLAPERHTERLQERPGVFVGASRRHDGDVETLDLVDLVEVDL